MNSGATPKIVPNGATSQRLVSEKGRRVASANSQLSNYSSKKSMKKFDMMGNKSFILEKTDKLLDSSERSI